MNHGDTDDTEIVSGDEGNLTPIEDISEVNNNFENEPAFDVPTLVDEQESSEPQQPVEPNSDWQAQVVDEAPATVETVSETIEPQKVKEQPNGWQRVRSLLFGSSVGDATRLNSLTQSIEDAPESAVNYVLRAEIYMDLHEYALAQSDFQRAIELAEVQFELADWGLVEQTMRDRAIAGLEKVQRRLR